MQYSYTVRKISYNAAQGQQLPASCYPACTGYTATAHQSSTAPNYTAATAAPHSSTGPHQAPRTGAATGRQWVSQYEE